MVKPNQLFNGEIIVNNIEWGISENTGYLMGYLMVFTLNFSGWFFETEKNLKYTKSTQREINGFLVLGVSTSE